MQSEKASKKIRKSASEPVVATGVEVKPTVEKTAKPRVPKSSLPKSDSVDTASAKRHRKPATVTVPEPAPVVEAPKTFAAAAGAEQIALEATPVTITKPTITTQHVQELAYEYWVAEGRPHGNHQEHWVRAERELGLIP